MTALPPYRIKAVEPIGLPARPERERLLREAGYNLFRLDARHVAVDLLTDSGTGAMSAAQWSAMMVGDESYAGSASFRRLAAAVREVLGFDHVLPVHQGRGAEKVLADAFIEPGRTVAGNAPFDTTRAHIEHRGGRVVDCTVDAARDPRSDAPFKGDVDLDRLGAALRDGDDVAYVLITVTCNTVGGHPVGLDNLRAVAKLAREHGALLFLDIARYAENALFIKDRDPDHRDAALPAIVQAMMELADGCAMSAKKDALVNIGGFLALRDRAVYDRLAPLAVLHEGFPTYGGLAGRDLEAMAVGLREGLDERFLRHHTGQVRALADATAAAGVPVVQPPGGHAVFLDAGAFLDHVPRDQFPGHALAIELYREGGVRSCEIGSLLAGRDPATGKPRRAPVEMTRLALPRRTYTRDHLDHVVDTVVGVWDRRDGIGGVRLVDEPPALRHFLGSFEPVRDGGGRDEGGR